MTWVLYGVWLLFCILLGVFSGDVASFFRMKKLTARVIMGVAVAVMGYFIPGWIEAVTK